MTIRPTLNTLFQIIGRAAKEARKAAYMRQAGMRKKERQSMRKREKQWKNTWQLQAAKARLSAVIDAAQQTPQTITVHGRPKAVVLEYRRFWPMVASYMETAAKAGAPSHAKNDEKHGQATE